MTSPAPVPRNEPTWRGLSWLQLMGLAAVIEAVLLLVAGAILKDAETIAFGVVVLAASAWFIRKPGVVPVLIRSLVFADVCFFMATATIANLSTHEALGAVVGPLALTVVSAVGLVSTAGYLSSRSNLSAGGMAPAALALAAVLVFISGLGVGAVSGGDPRQLRSGDVQLSAHGARFSATTLAAPAGQVSIYISNDDLFWHTLTLSQLGVDVRVPVKGHRRVTFTAAPGTYEFHCAIPGHEAIGMKGTLELK